MASKKNTGQQDVTCSGGLRGKRLPTDCPSPKDTTSLQQDYGQETCVDPPSMASYDRQPADRPLAGRQIAGCGKSSIVSDFFDFNYDGNLHILFIAGAITLIVLFLLRKIFHMFKGRRRRRRRRSRSGNSCVCRSRMPGRSRIHETKPPEVPMSTPEHYLIILIGIAILYLFGEEDNPIN